MIPLVKHWDDGGLPDSPKFPIVETTKALQGNAGIVQQSRRRDRIAPKVWAVRKIDVEIHSVLFDKEVSDCIAHIFESVEQILSEANVRAEIVRKAKLQKMLFIDRRVGGQF